ncbi:MAG TPA: hypothetical protein VN611_07320 [Patescibacteria group bacterium]|nr:hypothetical protein [Patescibacteria group bacterium]
MVTPGRLTLDFGDNITVAAYWCFQENRSRPLLLPGLSRPGGSGIPSRIFYPANGSPQAGQQAVPMSGTALFERLLTEVLTGKREYRCLEGEEGSGCRLARREAAVDFLSIVVEAAAAAMGLTPPELPGTVFLAPAAAMETVTAWDNYREFIAALAKRIRLRRWQLAETPWAAAWGGGLELRPAGAYWVVRVEEDSWEAVVVRVADRLPDDDQERRLRLLARTVTECAPVAGADADASRDFYLQGETALHQVRNRLRELGLHEADLQGVVLTGGAVQEPVRSWLRGQFAPLVMYDECPETAAACGAAALVAGVESCGYIRHDYGLRYWDEAMASHRYRVIIPAGTFFPSREAVTKLTVRVSYPEQEQLGLVICRLPAKHWKPGDETGMETVGGQRQDAPAGLAVELLNEDDRLLLPLPPKSVADRSEVKLEFAVDAARRLMVSARDPATGKEVLPATVVVRLQ